MKTRYLQRVTLVVSILLWSTASSMKKKNETAA
jgi:hypothetical protein